MKLTSTMKFVVALAVAAIAATSAKATQVTQYHDGDLLLGFYDSSGTVTNDYMIDLGPINTAIPDFYHNYTLNLGLNADLTHVFGSSWYTGGNVVFGLATSFPLSQGILMTNPNDGTPWTEKANQAGPAQNVANAGGAYGGSTQANGETVTNGLQQSNGASNSWATQAANGFGGYFGSGGDGAISDFANNPIEFDNIPQHAPSGTPSQNLGSFSLDNGGNLTFTAAVPEPSTYAALGLGAAVLAFARRRRA